VKLLSSLDDKIVSTVINYQEIFNGIDFEKSYDVEEDYYDGFFDDMILYNLGKREAKLASKIYSKEKRNGNMIGRFDSMIAGILLANGVNKIITKNTKHFSKIRGLKVLKY